MYYIVFDLEFNQDISSPFFTDKDSYRCPFEIIQIGAIKIDSSLNTVATFNRYVTPTIYPHVNPFITELTGITTEQLLLEASFPNIFDNFIEFIEDDEDDCVFCTWGMSDMKELFRNVTYHQLDINRLPKLFINLQPYVSTHVGLSHSKLLNLKTAVESLQISMPYPFHNALYDAYYTAELFKKIQCPSLHPKRYDPYYVKIRPKQTKKIIDFEQLILQFEKMYARELNKEEKDMIKLAYKMGKTHQFLK